MWKQNDYDGEGCFFHLQKNCFFKGIFEKGLKKIGIEIFPNGDQYEGEYQQELFHGKGCLSNKSMNYRYEGDFFKNQKHGKGVEEYKDARYEGEFIRGVPCGFGVHIAYSLNRAMTIMPMIVNNEFDMNFSDEESMKPADEYDNSEIHQEIRIAPENDETQEEYYYEGEFHDGHKVRTRARAP